MVVSSAVVAAYRARKNIKRRQKTSRAFTSKDDLRKALPDLKTFITRGGLYFSGKGRTDVQRQSLRSTVAFISPEKGGSPAIVSDDDGKLQLIENPEDRRESGMEKEIRLEDDQSP